MYVSLFFFFSFFFFCLFVCFTKKKNFSYLVHSEIIFFLPPLTVASCQMDQVTFTPTRTQTADHHMTPLMAMAALYRQGNQRRATLPSRRQTPSTAVRNLPHPCLWSPPCPAPMPARLLPWPPQTHHSPWAPTPVPRASWA